MTPSWERPQPADLTTQELINRIRRFLNADAGKAPDADGVPAGPVPATKEFDGLVKAVLEKARGGLGFVPGGHAPALLNYLNVLTGLNQQAAGGPPPPLSGIKPVWDAGADREAVLAPLRYEAALDVDALAYALVRVGSPPIDQGEGSSRSECSLRRVGEVWRLCYQGEAGDHPVRGTKCLGWLAKVLSKPNHSWTMAEVLGDPDGKLAADAALAGETETDLAGLKAIRNRREDIEQLVNQGGGWTDELADECANLLAQLKEAEGGKRILAPVLRAHTNVRVQLQKFLRDKLATDMPNLAAHLKASLDMKSPHIVYKPRQGHPRWVVENPSA